MKKNLTKITQKSIIGFLKNVCSGRTNLGLLLNLRKQNSCNRGIEYFD